MYKGKYAAKKDAIPKATATPVATAEEEDVVSSADKKARSVKKSTIIFYSIYALVLVALCVGIAIAMNALGDWLNDYEASQPDTKAQITFDTHFADPDWASIYTLAGLQDTQYESSEAFVAYMENKVKDTELTYIKTSAGLSGGHKYIVKLGSENLLTFTLQNTVQNQSDIDIPNWELHQVEVLLDRRESVTIQALPDQTVCINGIALTPEHIILSTSTVAEDYLPEGIHGAQSVIYYADGLLTAPEVTVTDANGQPVSTVYDAQSGMYTQPQTEHVLPEGVEARLVSAMQAYCRYMINAGGNMSSYFDTSSQIYKTIVKNEMWFKGYSSYEFTPETISAPYVYSDTLVSARISMQLNVTRSSNGTIKTFDVDNTVFLEKQSNGNWQIIEMVNVDVQQPRTQVRLTYRMDEQEISSEMLDANTASITLPNISVPEGKIFAGWFRETIDESGNKTLTLVFAPEEDNVVHLPSDYVLEPMDLIARFENEGA